MPIPTQKLSIEQNNALQDAIEFTTWFKTVEPNKALNIPASTGFYCPLCKIYHSIKYINLTLDITNQINVFCTAHGKRTFRTIFDQIENKLIQSFVKEYHIDPINITNLSAFIDTFNFIKTLE